MMSLFTHLIKKYRKAQREIEEEDRLDMEMAEESLTAEEGPRRLRLWPGRRRGSRRRRLLLFICCVCLTLIGGLLFLYLHVGTEYKVLMTEKRTDINGTGYTEFGEYILKYSPDGVTCVSGSGSVLWNSTFSMQSPIVDVRGTTAVIADQKGTQIYVFNQNGQQGQFQTSLPVEKVRVAKQGVVAAVLNDDDITWVNFYDAQGEEIAKSRNSLGDSGYPLDIALSPDGMKIMVSYLCITKGIMNTKICFYNFDSVGQAEINNMVASQIYENAVAPEVIFTDEGTSVAFLSNGFSIFKGKQIPEETKKVQFEEEILSIFHDGNKFGFIFKSDKRDYKYRMQLYDTNGKLLAKTYFDLDYKQVKLRGGSLIFFNDKEFEIYNTGGRKKFSCTYDKAIQDIIKVNGFQKYMVISQNSVSTIRLK